MDFLKKAKAGLKDIEADLTKATSSLGLGHKESESGTGSSSTAAAPSAPSGSEAETPASTTINTPATTTANTPAPSVIETPKVKLPLAIRKNVRDNWEAKQPELEEQISKLLGTPWKVSVDPGYLWSIGEEGFVKQNPGGAICAYIEPAIRRMHEYLEKFGDDGKRELNSLASAHTITIEETSRADISYSGSEISGGYLRILFAKKYLGTNVSSALDDLSGAVNLAGKTAASSAGSIPLDFDAKMSVRNDYQPKIGELQGKFQEMLKLSTFSLVPNFEANFASIAAHEAKQKRKDSNKVPHDWQKRFGRSTFEYFEKFYETMDYKNFPDDEMLQEGFAEAVEKNEIGLRVVEKLEKATYNECVLENGVLWIQTVPVYWTTNIRDPGDKILDLL